MGRPTIYSEDIADEVCRRLAEGESLRSICKDDHLPTKSTILLWVVDQRHESFSDQYRRAREAAGYAHADEITHIARELRDGEIDPQVAREIRGCLAWAAERMAPKTHSPRQEVTGPEGGPVQATVNVRFEEPDSS